MSYKYIVTIINFLLCFIILSASASEYDSLPIRQFGYGRDNSSHVSFTPDGKYFIGEFQSGGLLIDASTGVIIRRFPTPYYLGAAVVLMPDGKSVLTGSTDLKTRLLESNGKQKCLPQAQHRHFGCAK